MRAWNDWAAEVFNSYLPDRLSALAALPTTSPQDAVSELHRCVDLGHKGVLFQAYDLADLTDLNDDGERRTLPASRRRVSAILVRIAQRRRGLRQTERATCAAPFTLRL